MNDFKKRPPAPVFLGIGKVPPQALDMEMAVLGVLLLERECIDPVLEILNSPDVFYSDQNKAIFEKICALHTNGYPVDLLTITESLRSSNDIERVGGAYYLTNLTKNVTGTSEVEMYSRIIFEKYMSREIIRISGEAISEAYEDSIDIFDLYDQTENNLRLIQEGIMRDDSQKVGDIYKEVLADIAIQRENKSELIGVDTGYTELNKLLLGLERGTFNLLCARPSQGKTAFALNLAENAVVSKISPAGFVEIYSLESAAKPLVKRMAACRSKIHLEKIRKGNISDNDQVVLNELMGAFYQLPIKINDNIQSLSVMVKAIRRSHKRYLKTEKGKKGLPFMVVIDYLQLVKGSKTNSREQEISEISRTLKLLGIELDIIIIALCQLNREVEKRADKKPGLADIRESGSLEQDAQVAMFIWHEDTGENNQFGPIFKTWILVKKNKDGQCGDVQLKFAGDIQKWKNYDDMDQNEPASFLKNNYQPQGDAIIDENAPF